MTGTRLDSARGWAISVLVAVALAAGAGCSGDTEATGRAFEPHSDGVLTVATEAVPSPGFWEQGGPDQYVGFEAGLADEIADEVGAERVRVVRVAFDDIVAGRLGSADLALSQATPTSEREESADFTSSYLEAPPGVLARAGIEARDAQGLQDLRWVVTDSSTLTSVVDDRIRPDEEPKVVASTDEALDMLLAGRADAFLLDLPVAQAIAADQPDELSVLGQLGGKEGLAAVLPQDSANLDAVDAAIRKLRADGSIDDLADRWLGGDSGEVPLIRVDE